MSSQNQCSHSKFRDLTKEAEDMQKNIFALSIFSHKPTGDQKDGGGSFIVTETSRIDKHKDHIHSFARSVYLRIASYHAQEVLLQFYQSLQDLNFHWILLNLATRSDLQIIGIWLA